LHKRIKIATTNHVSWAQNIPKCVFYWGSLQCSQTSLAGFKGAASRQRGRAGQIGEKAGAWEGEIEVKERIGREKEERVDFVPLAQIPAGAQSGV